MAIGLLFFSAIGLLDIEYRIGDFKKLPDYRISDQGLNLSNSEKLSVAHLCGLLTLPETGALLSPPRIHISNKNYDRIITINVPLILKMWEIIFFLRTNHFMGHFKGYFEGAKTFLTLYGCARDNLGFQKVEAPSKYPEKWPIK
jgi:hypothetical protein